MPGIYTLLDRVYFENVQVITVAVDGRSANDNEMDVIEFPAVRFKPKRADWIFEALIGEYSIVRAGKKKNQDRAPRFFIGRTPSPSFNDDGTLVSPPFRDAASFLESVPESFNIFMDADAPVRLQGDGLAPGEEIAVALVQSSDIMPDGSFKVPGDDKHDVRSLLLGEQDAAETALQAAYSIDGPEMFYVLFRVAFEVGVTKVLPR